jgi:hypothetical protein
MALTCIKVLTPVQTLNFVVEASIYLSGGSFTFPLRIQGSVTKQLYPLEQVSGLLDRLMLLFPVQSLLFFGFRLLDHASNNKLSQLIIYT